MTYGTAFVRDVANPHIELFAGDFPPESKPIVLASGQDAKMGWVLGQVTATKEYKLCAKGANDGSQVPSAILVDDYDATVDACPAYGYLTGPFNEDAIAYGAGWTIDELRDELRKFSIFLKPVAAA
jgi:hypothetical protein